jgi:hypothetical protein
MKEHGFILFLINLKFHNTGYVLVFPKNYYKKNPGDFSPGFQ